MMAINLAQTSLQNFYLRTACHELNYTADICDRGVGEEFRAAEAGSQALVSSINVSRSFVGSLISTIVLLFVGPWSDCSGRRKPLLIVPLIGMCVTTTGVLLMVTFPGASTAQVLYVVQIPISMGGNFGLLLAASFSHIGDLCHTTGRDVTRTMGTHRAAIQIAHVVGSVSGPLLYRRLGFYGVFPLVLLLQVASLIYVVVMVRDVNVNRDNKVTVLNLRLPLNAVQCLVRKREGHKRIVILLMLVVALGDRMLLSAEVLLAYMYYRYKFQWDDVLFGSFLAYRNTISFAGTLLILTIFKRRLRLSDELVGVLSCTSYIIATSSLIAATTTIFVFIIPIIGIISQGSQVVQRPLLNKQILPTEQDPPPSGPPPYYGYPPPPSQAPGAFAYVPTPVMMPVLPPPEGHPSQPTYVTNYIYPPQPIPDPVIVVEQPEYPPELIDWVPTTPGEAHTLYGRAYPAGKEGWDGSPLWVIRSYHNGGLVPGKLAVKHRAAYIPFAGREIPVHNFEVLCAPQHAVKWVPASNGQVPPEAIIAGNTINAEPLYVGRVRHRGSLTPGKVQPSHEVCYISFGGSEVPLRQYEILCRTGY
ncbi:lysosomal proton-coupled steroid conjugate and bile acid symporter SLC46A3-like isoform X2 [Maniola hyperantus]